MKERVECTQDGCDGHLIRTQTVEQVEDVSYSPEVGLTFGYADVVELVGERRNIECSDCKTRYSKSEAEEAGTQTVGDPDAAPDLDIDHRAVGNLAAKALYEILVESELPGGAPVLEVRPLPDGPALFRSFEEGTDDECILQWRVDADLVVIDQSELTDDLISRLERLMDVTVKRGGVHVG